jgi:6-phosphogluconolactonase (cycloisomerase 2 family)
LNAAVRRPHQAVRPARGERSVPVHRRPLLLALAALVAIPAAVAPLEARGLRPALPGAVYTMSNDPQGNRILAFFRLPGGRLLPAGSVATGGRGTGAGLGNQGAVVLTPNQRWLLAVNAGSDSISVFAVRPFGLSLRDVEPSNGSQPVSLAVRGRLVYVLNAQSDTISGFRLTASGRLRPIPGSTVALSGGGTAPAQIAFTPDGESLVVTEKATSNIVTFPVDRHGVAGAGKVQPSNGATPFGFAFARHDQLLVSEAFGGAPDASAVSSYDVGEDGTLATIAASVPTTETAACWVAVTPDGRYAYVTNTGSGTVSGYSVGYDGSLALLDEDGRTATTGDGPIDLGISGNGRFLYTLNAGASTISSFRVHEDGSLVAIGHALRVPAGANGLAVR